MGEDVVASRLHNVQRRFREEVPPGCTPDPTSHVHPGENARENIPGGYVVNVMYQYPVIAMEAKRASGGGPNKGANARRTNETTAIRDSKYINDSTVIRDNQLMNNTTVIRDSKQINDTTVIRESQ